MANRNITYLLVLFDVHKMHGCPADTPAEEARTLQEILVECTSFEHAGAVDKQGKEQLIAEVAQSVESDADIPLSGTAQPAASPTTAERITSGLQCSPPFPSNWISLCCLKSLHLICHHSSGSTF